MVPCLLSFGVCLSQVLFNCFMLCRHSFGLAIQHQVCSKSGRQVAGLEFQLHVPYEDFLEIVPCSSQRYCAFFLCDFAGVGLGIAILCFF